MIEKLKRKMKWKIANFINNFESSCWADLVVWATSNSSILELWPWRPWYKESVWGCDCSQEGAYCGKCYETGRLKSSVREKEYMNIDRDKEYWNLPFEPITADNIMIEFKE